MIKKKKILDQFLETVSVEPYSLSLVILHFLSGNTSTALSNILMFLPNVEYLDVSTSC